MQDRMVGEGLATWVKGNCRLGMARHSATGSASYSMRRRSCRRIECRHRTYSVRARNAAKLCHAAVIPIGTAKAPTAKMRGAAQMLER